MKMKATIEVEYEAQRRSALESALMRGVVALTVAIERGTFAGQTEIKERSVMTFIRKREITD